MAKAQKEKLSILRMKGVIQSYELYDSVKYNKARQMKEMLEEEQT